MTETQSPLESVTREQILSRLTEAVRLTQENVSGHLDRLRELFADLADRTDALGLVQRLDARDAPARPASLLTCSALSCAGGEPVSEFLLIPFGEVTVERPSAGSSFVFSRQHAESAKRWFDTISRKLAVDYEHQSFDRFNTRTDGLRPAAGWISGLEIRADGLWAVDVTWTERAKQLLRSGEYRYFSPVVFWTDEERSDVAALGPVALTNDPAMRGVPPLAAARQPSDEDSETDAAESAPVLATTEPSWCELDLVPRAELGAAEAENELLRRKLAAQEADTFVQRGMRLGKVLDSTSMDWREDYLRSPEAAEQRLARAPVLLPPGRVLTLNCRGEVEPLSASERDFRRHGDIYRRWGVQPEDLAAYERAAAAGRIVGAGLGE